MKNHEFLENNTKIKNCFFFIFELGYNFVNIFFLKKLTNQN